MYRLEITKDYLDFAAAHFITFKGKCERLHGHNYQMWVEIEGELTEDGYVFDFTELKAIAKNLCAALDHRVLLATNNPQIRVWHEGSSTFAEYRSQRYQFPTDDVVLLPIGNTTAELIATYLAQQFVQHLRQIEGHFVQNVGVWIAEGPGQRAFFRAAL